MSNKNQDEHNDNCPLSLSGGGYEVYYSQGAKNFSAVMRTQQAKTRELHLNCIHCQHIDNTSVDSPCWACRPGESHGTNFTPYHEYNGSEQNKLPRLHWWERFVQWFKAGLECSRRRGGFYD